MPEPAGRFKSFLTTPAFRKAFAKLPSPQQRAAIRAFQVFKMDPFAPSLRTHLIKKLSSRYRRSIYAVEILGNLRAVFYTDGETVVSVDIGTHDIYR